MLRRWGIWSLTAAAICACGPADGAREASHEAQTALIPEAVFSDDALGSIVDLAPVGDRLVGLDALLDPSVHVFDRVSLRRLGSYGRTGDGPGEFKDPEQIVPGAPDSPDEVWILDGVHQRLTRLSLDEIEAGQVVDPQTLPMDGPNAGSLVRYRMAAGSPGAGSRKAGSLDITPTAATIARSSVFRPTRKRPE